MNLNPITFLLLSQVIIFLLGWPLEWTEIIIIFVPIFLPMLPHFGIDPMLFGVLVALNLQTAFLSPPMAMAAYYLKGVSPPHGAADADLQRLHAVRLHRAGDDGDGLRLPADRAVAAEAFSTAADAMDASRLELAVGQRRGARDPRRRDQRRAAGRGLPGAHPRGRAAGAGLAVPRSGARAGAGARARRRPPRRAADRAAARRAGRHQGHHRHHRHADRGRHGAARRAHAGPRMRRWSRCCARRAR